MDIATRLRAALKARDYSIRGLHKALQGAGLPETSYPAVHRYLKGEVDPPAEFVSAVVRLLRIRPEWLLLGTGPALEEEWEEERLAFGRELLRNAEDPSGDIAFINTLPLGPEHFLDERRAALLRFNRKLFDASLRRDSAWSGVSQRGDLLAAAGRFLVGVDAAFATASERAADPHERQAILGGTLDGLLVIKSASRAWAAVWYDAVLDLFGRRVIGLGERDPRNRWDAHTKPPTLDVPRPPALGAF